MPPISAYDEPNRNFAQDDLGNGLGLVLGQRLRCAAALGVNGPKDKWTRERKAALAGGFSISRIDCANQAASLCAG
jgi:hypothetical protein